MPEKELDKNSLFDEFIKKPVTTGNIGDFSYFFYQIERNEKRSLVKLKAFDKMDSFSKSESCFCSIFAKIQ